MNCQEAVNEGIAAFRRATTNNLASRTILVLSILDVTPRAEVAKALADVDSAGKSPSASTIRRNIGRTTRQMGLPDLPTGEKGGRPSFELCGAYKREHCARWIAANGGMPRIEQLTDPNWDLRPYPPADSSALPSPISEQVSETGMNSPQSADEKNKKLPKRANSIVPSVDKTRSVSNETHEQKETRETETDGSDEDEMFDAVPEMPVPFRLTWNDPWAENWRDHFECVKDAEKLLAPEAVKAMKGLSLKIPRDRWVCRALLLHAQAQGIPYDPSHYERYLETIRSQYKKLLKEYWISQG
jgi:hypothetical protein